MSLSWLDRSAILIHPERVVIERRPWRGALERRAGAVASGAAGEADWQPALAAMRSLLGSGRGRGTARVVVADHFVRYALLPWSELLVGGKARQAMAQAIFRETLGDKATALEIALDRPRFGSSGVAAGIDRAFLGGLRQAVKAAGLRLESLQPRLLHELAAAGRRLDNGWFACLDSGRIAIVGIRRGEAASLRNHRSATTDPVRLGAELASLVAGEQAGGGERRLVICADRVATPVGLGPDWRIEALQATLSGEAHA